MEFSFGHEKLQVYQRALAFISWRASAIEIGDRRAAVWDQFERASESIVKSLANGNSRRSAGDRARFFDVAAGSGLECAACLDICHAKRFIPIAVRQEGKRALHDIVRMTIGLRKSTSPHIREGKESYQAEISEGEEILFSHERLDVYQHGLQLIHWLDQFLAVVDGAARSIAALDRASTSFLLNVAEGNGRFSETDHARFLDIAHTCLMNTASGLDILTAGGAVDLKAIQPGKQLIARLGPMLLGLRGYLDNA